MPVDLEMFLSASRFEYSSFVDSLGYDNNEFSSSLPFTRDHVVVGGRSRRFGVIQDKSVFPAFETKTEFKPPDRKTSITEKDPDVQRKKKVSFADDKGLDLVKIREIPGVPKWSDNVLSILIGDQKAPGPEKIWQPSFDQPPWSDSKLLELLNQNEVVLESVSVTRESSDVLRGTVKVKNIVYEKNVFVRVSFDRWVSYVDSKAEYMEPKVEVKRAVEYDTFEFNIKISPSAMRYGVIEFCVCFQASEQEFWDNNGGINYRLTAEPLDDSSLLREDSDNVAEKISLSLSENFAHFSEISAWGNFMYSRPYW